MARKKPKKDDPCAPATMPEHLSPVTDPSALETVRRAGQIPDDVGDLAVGYIIARAGSIGDAVALLQAHPGPDWIADYLLIEEEPAE